MSKLIWSPLQIGHDNLCLSGTASIIFQRKDGFLKTVDFQQAARMM